MLNVSASEVVLVIGVVLITTHLISWFTFTVLDLYCTGWRTKIGNKKCRFIDPWGSALPAFYLGIAFILYFVVSYLFG